MRPDDRPLLSQALPPTRIQRKEKALVLSLVTQLGAQDGDCAIPCLSRGEPTTVTGADGAAPSLKV